MFKNKYISLLLLWSLGLVMLMYLSMPLFSNENKIETGSTTTTEQGYHSENSSEAYVIVTIDEKHFLTRFASYVPTEIETPMVMKATGRPVERVIMKIRPEKGKKKTEDFTIKPAPLE